MAPKLFPLCCLLTVLIFYVASYQGLRSLGQSPPAAAILATEASLSRAQASSPMATNQPIATATASNSASGLLTAKPEVAVSAAALSTSMVATTSASTTAAVERSASSVAPTPAAARLDGSLAAALQYAVPTGKPRFVLATFGNLGVRDQLINFVRFCTRAGAAHVVGAVDVGAYDLIVGLGSATYKTPLANTEYRLDGSNQHSSGSWKKFAGMRTGEVKRIVLLGYTVLHTDCDVVFLRDPAPYLMCGSNDEASVEWGAKSRWPCAPMREADVAVSSDNMSPDRDAMGHASYAAGGTFNTGLLLIRPTPSGRRFVEAWHRNVVDPPRGSRFYSLTSDQQVFNHMMRKDREWPGISAPHGAWVMDPWDKSLRLGALPMPLFINGHGYFVQKAHERLKVAPIAVHATYSLDNHDSLAKTQRFREAGLWAADPPEFASGRYLAFNHTLSPAIQAAVDKYVQRGEAPSNIDVHATALQSYVAELRDALALSIALHRTLVLPRWTCYCDRLWSGSDDIFHFGCMYPGSQDGKFVPFTCPMDHVLSPSAWHTSGVAHRDSGFVDRLLSQRPGTLVREIHVGDDGAAATNLPLGQSEAQVAQHLTRYASDTVLRLSRARGLLSGLEGDVHAFNRLAALILTPPPWCSTCFQRCDVELKRWLDTGTIEKGARGQGPNRWCAPITEPPTPFGAAARRSVTV